MSEKNTKQEFLLLRELLNESLLRDLIIFVIFYLFILTQSWKNIFLLLFPVITYTFSLFFRLINANKWRLSIYDNTITYNPLGGQNAAHPSSDVIAQDEGFQADIGHI